MPKATTNRQIARQGKTTLIALIAVLVVLAVAVGGVWFWRSAETKPDIDAGRVAADRFLEQIRAGKPADAWQATTAEFKSAEGRETFSKNVKQHPLLKEPATFVSVQSVTVQGQPRAEYLYRAGKEKGKGMIRLLAGLENDTWRVDRLTIE